MTARTASQLQYNVAMTVMIMIRTGRAYVLQLSPAMISARTGAGAMCDDQDRRPKSLPENGRTTTKRQSENFGKFALKALSKLFD